MTAQSFAYEKKGNSAVIWRCFSRDTRAEIPAEIEGLPVNWIAPYAFSAHMDERTLQKGIQDGRILIYVPEALRLDDSLPPALCGSQVEAVRFPDTVAHVGRYCFYNCDNLQELEYHGALADWGSGSFTGCHKIKKLRVGIPENGITYLKMVLEELREELLVEYIPDRWNALEPSERTDDGYASLIFPEFYEEGIENTPARILEERMHGTGMHYRYCFYSKVFDFRQYDSLFSYAVTQESVETMAELAMGRLRHPYSLEGMAREQYTDYIKEHAVRTAELLLKRKDTAGIRWLLGVTGQDQKLMDYITERASALHDVESLSYLMEHRRAGERPARRRREL